MENDQRVVVTEQEELQSVIEAVVTKNVYE
jgi:hypothetical protein